MTGILNFQRLSITLLFLIALLLDQKAFADNGAISYQTASLYQLPAATPSSTKWLAPHSISFVNQDALIANSQGRFFQITNNTVSREHFLDLSTIFPAHIQLKLTAFSLHPSFALPNKTGEGIIYTAHIESAQSSSMLLIKDAATPDEAIIDTHAVITEWQLGKDNNRFVQSGEPREVTRIALIQGHKGITQLGFNPYLKSWNDGFGLLHAVLPSDEKLSHVPLYSGSILRINPARFALKHYTVPSNNPFLKKHKILNEIVAFGAQNIQQIHWSKHDQKKLIVTHNYAKKAQISYGKIGSDWLKKAPLNVIWSQESSEYPLSTSLFNLNRIEHLSVLHQQNNSWKITTLNLSQLNKNAYLKEWVIEPSFATVKTPMQLVDNSPLPPTLYNIKTQEVFSITASSSQPNNTQKPSAEESQSSIDYVLIAMILVLIAVIGVMGSIVYWVYNRYNGENIKPILRKNFSHFQCIKSTISLYKRRQTSPAQLLNVKDIVSTEICLNDAPILLINADAPFDNEVKANLLRSFSLEQQYKMTSTKVRKVMMKLTDTDKHVFSICLYLRKGDQRYTKLNYQLAQTKIIEWGQLYTKVNQASEPRE